MSEAIRDSRTNIIPVSEKYREICEEVEHDFDKWLPDGYLKKTAELVIANNLRVLSCEKINVQYDIFAGKVKIAEDEKPYYCMINCVKKWQTMSAIIDKGIEFLRGNSDGICCFVTDARCDFSATWMETIEKRKKFETLGGRVIILDRRAAVLWFGLAWFHTKVLSGEITVKDGNVLRSLTEPEFKNLIRFNFTEFEETAKFNKLLN